MKGTSKDTKFNQAFNNIRKLDKLDAANLNAVQTQNFDAIRSRLNLALVHIAQIDQEAFQADGPQKETLMRKKEALVQDIDSTLREIRNLNHESKLKDSSFKVSRRNNAEGSFDFLNGVASTVTDIKDKNRDVYNTQEVVNLKALAAVLTGESHENFPDYNDAARKFVMGTDAGSFVGQFRAAFPYRVLERGKEANVANFLTQMRNDIEKRKASERGVNGRDSS